MVPCPRVPEHVSGDYDADGRTDTELSTQGDVEKLAGCTDVVGSLYVRNGDITDLTPLANLRRIGGSLRVYGNSDPKIFAGPGSLAGLEGLEAVGGLYLEKTRLTDLAPLAGLTEIAGDVRLERNALLVSLEGLHNLTHIGGALMVNLSPALTDLTGLRGLRAIGVRLWLGGLPISSLHGLEGLTTIGTVGGESHVGLFSLDELTTLEALAGVEWRPEHNIWIYETGIPDLSLFAGVEALTRLDIDGNAVLTSLAGLEALTTVSGELRLGRNEKLTELGALAGLRSVGALTWEGTALTDIVMPALEQPVALRISDNDQLTSLSFLSGATQLASLILEDNVQLAGVPELSALVEVDGSLELRANAAMTDLDDLAALTRVGGRLAVVYNAEIFQSVAEDWAAPIQVDGDRKIVGNKGYDAPPLEPCPWANDGECDASVCDARDDGADCLSD